MGFLSQLFEKFARKDAFTGTDQTQREALVDALTFAIMADGQFEGAELSELTDAIAHLPWRSDTSREQYITDALNRLEQVTASAQAARDYCQDISARLGTPEAREQAYAFAARIVCSDQEVVDHERGLMSIFIQEFGISAERAVALSADAHEAFELL